MAARHPSFESVRDYPEPMLRDLLASTEQVERLWAAWALGLRLGARSAAPIERAARHDPDAGLRRHLIVVLAGFGEHDVLATLASDDPDAHVRATASQYLARLAEARPASWRLVLERLGDADPIVRETLVLQLSATAPPEVRAAALERIDDPTPAIRDAVVQQLDSLIGTGSPLPDSIKARLSREPVRDLRKTILAAWIDREGGASLLHALASEGRVDLKMEAFDRLADKEPRLQWADVQEIAEAGPDEVRRRVFSLFANRLDEVPLGWLLKYVASHGWSLDATTLVPRLARVASLADGEQRALVAVGGWVSRELSEGAGESLEDEYEKAERVEWEQRAEALLVQLRRLCGTS